MGGVTILILYAGGHYFPEKLPAIHTVISTVLLALGPTIIGVSAIGSGLGRTDELQDERQLLSAREDSFEYLKEKRVVDKTDPRFDEIVRTVKWVFETPINSPATIKVDTLRWYDGIYVNGEPLLDEQGASCRIKKGDSDINNEWDELEARELEAKGEYQSRLRVLGLGILLLGATVSLIPVVRYLL